MKHTLEVDSVFLEFGNRRILSDIYMSAETGKITGLLSRNGQGKTCLLNIIYGNLSPQNRSVRFDSISTPQAFKRIDLVRYLPQHSFTPKTFNVKRVFDDFVLDFGVFKTHFPDFDKYYLMPFGNLSGGEIRLIEVYCIIKANSLFSMLDEPFSHIMPIHVETIKEILLVEKLQKGFIITDHLFRHIMELSDSLYVLKDGKTYLTKSREDIETLGYVHL